MASFTKGPIGQISPFGRNEFLRSDRDIKTTSYTVAAATVPAQTIDGVAGQKILQPGTVMAKITAAGPDQGKVGPFQAGATDGRQTLTNVVGIDLTFLPWQLTERDVEISVVYEASVVQAWCFEYDAAGNRIALTNTTAAGLVGQKSISILFN
jgi:hypothetical protein